MQITWSRLRILPRNLKRRLKRLLQSEHSVIEQRQQFAELNNWDHRYEALHGDIVQYLFPKVSVILVVHNNWSYTQQCLHRLLQPGHYPNLEIIIVDNASNDQTSAYLRSQKHPLIKVITSPTNLGFAAGNTLGCAQSSGEFIILLNNDTLVPDGSWISRLLRPFQKDEMLAMTGPMSNHVGNDQALDHFIGDAVQGAHPAGLANSTSVTGEDTVLPICLDFSVPLGGVYGNVWGTGFRLWTRDV